MPGGKLERGETFDAPLRREVEEETGLQVIMTRTAGAWDFEMPRVHVCYLPFDAAVQRGTLRVSSVHSEAKWCGTDELKAQDLAPPVKGFLDSSTV